MLLPPIRRIPHGIPSLQMTLPSLPPSAKDRRPIDRYEQVLSISGALGARNRHGRPLGPKECTRGGRLPPPPPWIRLLV